MPLEQIKNKDEIVCFLIINYIPFLPSISIGSCLVATDCPIVVGFINEDDIRDIPISPRISRVNLRQVPRCRQILTQIDSGFYRHFGSQDFFNLVQLKWHLFAELFSLNFQRIIYSDIDTIWMQDAVILTRLENTQSLLQIQDVTIDVRTPRLCMGFISMVNNPVIIQMIEDCALENEQRLLAGEQVGDDDIITDYYKNHGYPTWIKPLPQLAFPTGNMLTQYISKPAFRPVEPPRPILFHANYIIGQKNKAIILERIRYRLKVPTTDRPSKSTQLSLRINFFIVRICFWYHRFVRVFGRVLISQSRKKLK